MYSNLTKAINESCIENWTQSTPSKDPSIAELALSHICQTHSIDYTGRNLIRGFTMAGP